MENLINNLRLMLLKQPNTSFFSSLAYTLPINLNSQLQKPIQFNSENTSIEINPEQLSQYNNKEQVTILCHTLIHYALQHDLRKGDREDKRWNEASDIVVNEMLDDMGFDLSNIGKVQYEYRNKTVEQIYELLKSETQNDSNSSGSNPNNNNSPTSNDIKFSQGEPSNQEIMERNAQTQKAYTASKMSKKSVGLDSSTELKELLAIITEPKVDWRKELYSYVDEYSKGKYSYTRFNRRYIPHDLYIPDNFDMTKIHSIAVAIDVSCSVSEKDIRQFLGEIQLIKNQVDPEKLILISHNTNIVQKIELSQSQSIDDVPKLKIYGGTSFSCVTNYLNKLETKPKFLIWFTDLECNFPNKPEYPIIWVTLEKNVSNPPYGKLIFMERDND